MNDAFDADAGPRSDDRRPDTGAVPDAGTAEGHAIALGCRIDLLCNPAVLEEGIVGLRAVTQHVDAGTQEALVDRVVAVQKIADREIGRASCRARVCQYV